MSLAFILFCLWLAAHGGLPFVPAGRRPQARFGLLAAGGLIVLLALVGQGLVVAMFAASGVLALYPQPLSWVQRLVARRLATWQAPRPA